MKNQYDYTLPQSVKDKYSGLLYPYNPMYCIDTPQWPVGKHTEKRRRQLINLAMRRHGEYQYMRGFVA